MLDRPIELKRRRARVGTVRLQCYRKAARSQSTSPITVESPRKDAQARGTGDQGQREPSGCGMGMGLAGLRNWCCLSQELMQCRMHGVASPAAMLCLRRRSKHTTTLRGGPTLAGKVNKTEEQEEEAEKASETRHAVPRQASVAGQPPASQPSPAGPSPLWTERLVGERQRDRRPFWRASPFLYLLANRRLDGFNFLLPFLPNQLTTPPHPHSQSPPFRVKNRDPTVSPPSFSFSHRKKSKRILLCIL